MYIITKNHKTLLTSNFDLQKVEMLLWLTIIVVHVLVTCGPSLFMEMAINNLEEIQGILSGQLLLCKGLYKIRDLNYHFRLIS